MLSKIAIITSISLLLSCNSPITADKSESESKRTAKTENSGGSDSGGPNVAEKKGNDSSQAPGGSQIPASGDEIDILVPMGLWDVAALDSIVQSIPLTMGVMPDLNAIIAAGEGGGVATLQVPIINAEEVAKGVEAGLQAVPRSMIGMMRQMLATLALAARAYLGENGIFAGQEIAIKTVDGKGHQTYKVQAPTFSGTVETGYVVISYDVANTYPYAFEVFEAVKGSTDIYRRLAVWSFAKTAEDQLAFHVKTAQAAGANQLAHLVLEYAQGSPAVKFLAGMASEEPGLDRLAIDYRFDNGVAMAQGAYALKVPTTLAPDTPGVPRYATVQKGDAHLFRIISDSTTASLEATQQFAFAPVATAKDLGHKFTADVFVTRTYVDKGLSALADLLQNPVLNPACATTAAMMRAKLLLDGVALPASLEKAPQSFCAADAALSAKDVASIVYDICGVSPKGLVLSLPLALTSAVFGSSIDLCQRLDAVFLLSNSQRVFLNTNGSGEVEVYSGDRPASLDAFLTRNAANDIQRQLLETMQGLPFPDTSYIGENDFPAEITKAVSEFAGAKSLNL